MDIIEILQCEENYVLQLIKSSALYNSQHQVKFGKYYPRRTDDKTFKLYQKITQNEQSCVLSGFCIVEHAEN